jgi:hypothetical protein
MAYHFSHTSSSFCFGYLGARFSLFAQLANCDLPDLSFSMFGMTNICYCAQLLVEMGLGNFLPSLALNYDPLDLILPSR